MARRKYSDLILNGTWACPNTDQEKLIALASDFKKINKVLSKPVPKKGKELMKKPAGVPKTQRPICPEDEWKYIPPTMGAPQVKMKGAKQYHWCIFHHKGKGIWTVHVTSACQPEDGKQPAAIKKKNMHTTTQVNLKFHFNANTSTIKEASNSE